jgi:anti-anti-sigma regulatory factor/anti-sigma regulatory factor (Ser/Thr protein kinase)
MIVNVTRDFERGVTAVSLAGELAWKAAAGLRSLLLKAIADCPIGVIVDLAGVGRCNDIALSIFATVRRHARQEPAVALELCASHPELARQLRRSFRHVPVHDTYEDALLAVNSHPAASYWTHRHLVATAEAPSLARVFVGDACLDWDLPQLLRPARWIVSELTQNAVEHAGTDIDVTATLRGRYLHLGVHDRSPEPPRLRKTSIFNPRAPMEQRGEGLRIVGRYSAQWGCVITPDGKNVWAILTVDPGGAYRIAPRGIDG